MKEMKTLTLKGTKYEIVDAKARAAVANINNDNKRASAPPITMIASGEPVAVTDSSDRPFNNMRIFGKTKQVTTTGAQLFDITKYIGVTNEVNGVTWVVNADGSITGSGTPTASAGWELYNGAIPDVEKLYFSLQGSYNNVHLRLYLYDAPGTMVNSGNYIMITSGDLIDLADYPTATTMRFAINRSVSDAAVSGTFYIMVNAGDTAATYEPYTGGMASPRPDWSQELESVENPTINILGKNLIECPFTSSASRNGITIVNTGDGGILVSGTASAYTEILLYGGYGTTTTGFPFDTVLSGGTVNVGLHAFRYDANKKYIGVASSRDNSVTVNASPGIAIALAVEEGQTVLDTIYPMLSADGMTDEHESYKTPQTLALTRTLHGIPVTSHGNYTDSNGQQWVCDEIDFERGLYIQRCFRETLAFTFQEDLNRYSAILTHMASNAFAIEQGIPVVSKTLPFNPACGSGTPIVNGIRVAASSPKYAIAYYNGEVIESADVIYPLAVPIETKLTEEELAAFDPLYSHSTSTTILNDAGAWIEIKYAADFHRYVDSVIYDVVYNVVDDSITADEIQVAVDNWLNAHYTNAEGVSF